MKINHCVKKITICDLYCVFRMMKILLILFMLGIGNAFSGIYSQNTLLSLEINRQSIKEVLGEIEKKSEYVFFFSENTRKELDKKVNIHVVSKTLNVILDQLFNETDLVYTINNRQVSIAKSGRQTLPADSLQQTKKVSGRVVDQEGSPLIGVTILVKGTQQGAITDVNGEFQLTADENAALLFSYVGFENATYPLAKLPKTIVLKEQSGMIEEVVVTG
ncbi:MAG: carboxypeptidase-like regulatory domain-containing protein, partial [Dysgonamonadaceae bacterium]|nr:carboxypeptidase-like regulatory domain-containing protein [Dysgonamonadaceae bacterium]